MFFALSRYQEVGCAWLARNLRNPLSCSDFRPFTWASRRASKKPKKGWDRCRAFPRSLPLSDSKGRSTHSEGRPTHPHRGTKFGELNDYYDM